MNGEDITWDEFRAVGHRWLRGTVGDVALETIVFDTARIEDVKMALAINIKKNLSKMVLKS